MIDYLYVLFMRDRFKYRTFRTIRQNIEMEMNTEESR
jgi:hypothetical protein